MLMKYCKKCGKIIAATMVRCEDCEAKHKAKQREYNLTYDNTNRSRESTTFYKSPVWKAKSKQMYHRYNYIDVYLWYMTGEVVVADAVHHIVPIKEDRSKSIVSSNLICLSDRTHKMVHAYYDKGEGMKAGMQKLLSNLVDKWENDNNLPRARNPWEN